MTSSRRSLLSRSLLSMPFLSGALLEALQPALRGQEKAALSPALDAPQAAPASHKVVFENSFIRVLSVTLPDLGSPEPMHYHPWPSLFLSYETGGKSPHYLIHVQDGPTIDIPSRTTPVHGGVWEATWHPKPDTLHSIELLDKGEPGPGSLPGILRIEVKLAGK